MVDKEAFSILQIRACLTGRRGYCLDPVEKSLLLLMPRKISVSWSRTLVCDAQVSQQWSEACLSYTLESGVLYPLGYLISVMSPQTVSGEFPQEPISGWSHSSDRAAPITCAHIVGVFPCQMCLL